ncbi:MAG TPA: hypothetical protein VIQ53_02780, partial [Inquilinus sp.]
MDQIRSRLLSAALADHDGLAAALAAAREAEAWLQGGQVPAPAPMLFLPASAVVELPAEIALPASATEPTATAPSPELPIENGHDAHSAAAPSGPVAWLEETLSRAREIEARLGHIRQSDLAFVLNITYGIAGYRLRVMMERGLALATGNTNNRRYRLIELPAFDP